MFVIFYPFSKGSQFRRSAPGECPKTKAQLIAELACTRARLRDSTWTARFHTGQLSHRRRQRMLFGLSTELSRLQSIQGAGLAVLRALCEAEGWDIGVLWLKDEKSGDLSMSALWQGPRVEVPRFQPLSEAMRVQMGHGILGRIGQSGAPAWFFEFSDCGRSERTSLLAQAGIRWSYYFPIHDGDTVRGLFEFYSARPKSPDGHQLRTVVSAGKMLAQCVSRIQHETKCQAYERAMEGSIDYAFFQLSARGEVGCWSLEAERLLGYAPDEVLGCPISVTYPPNEGGLATRNLQLAVQLGHLKTIGLRQRKDGTKFWAEVLVVPMRDVSGHLIGFNKVIHHAGDYRPDDHHT